MKNKYRNNNIDAIRYILAFSVIVAHFNALCGFDIYWPVSSQTGVGGFFAISGYLIYASYEKRPVFRQFIISRAIRIMPPYVFIVLVCAFVLVFVSSLSPEDYFTSPQWSEYLIANLLFMNFMEPELPGVFQGQEFSFSAVNGSLWTMKVEWCLYLTVPLVVWYVTKYRKQNRQVRLFLTIIAVSVLYTLLFNVLYIHTEKGIYKILSRQFFGQLSFFYVGVLLAKKKDFLMRYKKTVIAVLVISYIAMHQHVYMTIALRPVVEGGIIIWLSVVGRWGRFLSGYDNISYDMYLFHFPILQLAVYFGLPAFGGNVCFAVCCLAVILFSIVSWKLIGKPSEKLKLQLVSYGKARS